MEAKVLAISAAAFVGFLAVGASLQTGLLGAAGADEPDSTALSLAVTATEDGADAIGPGSTVEPGRDFDDDDDRSHDSDDDDDDRDDHDDDDDDHEDDD